MEVPMQSHHVVIIKSDVTGIVCGSVSMPLPQWEMRGDGRGGGGGGRRKWDQIQVDMTL